MAAGSSDSGGRQVWYLETIEELEESESEAELEDSVLLGVRRRGRVSLVKQSTPAHTEESCFTVSCSGDSSLASGPLRARRSRRSRGPPHRLLPSLQEADDAPGGPDQSLLPGSPSYPLAEVQSERSLRPRGPGTAVMSPGESSPPREDTDAESKDEDWVEPAASKKKKNKRPNRRLSMRSEDGEAPVAPPKKKRLRKKDTRKKDTIPGTEAGPQPPGLTSSPAYVPVAPPPHRRRLLSRNGWPS
ncbi:uncharacterized protein LOC135260771 isoform X1 [Anguilla rostrata]|uniref:uncharacterized protein LOC135260771 isoform X1 n=1 Tax=Anguilla rostrata TaxID=7938 RepID=UPI0030D1174B